MKVDFINRKKVLVEAVKKEILSLDKNDQNFINNFTYIYSLDGVHYFQNNFTKKCGYDKETIMNSLSI